MKCVFCENHESASSSISLSCTQYHCLNIEDLPQHYYSITAYELEQQSLDNTNNNNKLSVQLHDTDNHFISHTSNKILCVNKDFYRVYIFICLKWSLLFILLLVLLLPYKHFSFRLLFIQKVFLFINDVIAHITTHIIIYSSHTHTHMPFVYTHTHSTHTYFRSTKVSNSHDIHFLYLMWSFSIVFFYSLLLLLSFYRI